MVRIFNQRGYEVGRFTNDRDDAHYSQWGDYSGLYPPGSWGCSISHYYGFYALIAQVEGVWKSLGVYATENEAREVWSELADTVKSYKNVPTPATLPEYHVPRGKKPVDPYQVYRAFKD